MTGRRYRDEAFARAAAAFEAHLARHQVRIERSMAAHERGLEAAGLRIAIVMEAAEFRMRGRIVPKGPRKPPRGKRRPDEGGEPAPVKPRPKPIPLTGTAAAPFERD